MKFSDYLIGNQGGEQMSSQTPIQPQQMQSIAPQQSMQSSVTDFGIKPNQSAPKKKVDTFDVLGMLEKTNQFTQQAIKDNPVSKGNTVYTGRNKNIREIQEGIEQSTKETHKLNTLLDMKRYIDDGATLEEFQADFGDVPQEILPQIYEEFAYGTKMKDILKLYPELDNIQPPQKLREKYDIKKFFNPLGEAGKTILKAKEKAKEDGSFLTSNPLTQGFMGTVGGAVKSVGDLGAGIVGISDKINSLGRSITEGGDIDQYSERPSSLSEDVFNTVSGGVGTVGSVFAMPASILINTGIEALPRDYQVALSDSMDWLGDKIAQTPGLKQWMESLPVERQNEFKQELANAGFGLLIGLKGKKNIITDPKLFLKENINPISIARNFNENVLGLPTATGKIMEGVASQLGDKVSTVAKGAKSKLSAMGKGVKGEVSFGDRAIAVMNGLDAETVRKFKDSPDIVKALDEGKITKESIKTDLVSAVDDVLSERNTVGSQYSEVYKNPERFDTNDIIEDINSSLLEQGVKIKDNKIVGFDTTKITGLTDQAKTALKSKYKDTIQTLLGRKDLSVEELHNIRRDLYSTSYQDGFANKKAPGVSKVSDVLNERLKNIPGFKEIDSGYKEAADLVSELKNNVLTKDGDFKGTLKALLGERGAKRMDILEKHFPGLRDKIETLAAYDDYLNTRNRKKVGLYEKVGAGAVVGFTMGGGLGAVIGAMAGPILSDFVRDPKWFKNYIISKAGDNIANKIELGKRLNINERTRVTRALKEIIKNPQAALPYKGELGETPNTILSQQKEIISSPNGNFRKGQILETNLSKNATTNTPNTNDNSISVKNKPKTNTLVSKTDGMKAPSKELQPLYEEARKYKSADEMINGLEKDGKILYHGTNAKFDEFDINKKGSTQGFDESGIFFTDDIDRAKTYNADYIDKATYSMTIEEKAINNSLNVLKSSIDTDGFITMSDLTKMYEDGIIKTKPDFSKSFRPESFFDNNRQSIKEAVAKGVKGIKHRAEGETVYMVADSSKIKTEAQLRKIREEANKELQPLYEEARKYKSADEFEKRFRDETYNANNVDTKISDKAKEFNRKYVPLLEDGTTKKYKENIQSIIEDTTLDTDSMLEKIKPIKEKLYNYQKSQLRKIREEANK